MEIFDIEKHQHHQADQILYGFFKAPFGSFLLATLDEKICALLITSNEKKALATLKNSWPGSLIKSSEKKLAPLARKICNHPHQIDTPLIIKGSEFQKRVWHALTQIPWGETTTYQDLAENIGNKGAARAVGTAAGKNLIGFLIPCHRLIPKTGGVGGYAFGSKTKQTLLDWEKNYASNDR